MEEINLFLFWEASLSPNLSLRQTPTQPDLKAQKTLTSLI